MSYMHVVNACNYHKLANIPIVLGIKGQKSNYMIVHEYALVTVFLVCMCVFVCM